jgi:arylsulfatase A-like enzyme
MQILPIMNKTKNIRIAKTGRRLRGNLCALLPLTLPLASGCVSTAGAEGTSNLGQKYNVLFIVSDDLRPELGCYGQPQMKTPNLDRLAARGTAFQRAYCQVAVCNPSRSSVLSGLRPDTIGIYDQSKYLRRENPDIVTLPQLFKNHGYQALSVGKVFHHSPSEPGNDPESWSVPMYGFMQPYRHWFTKESNEIIKALRKDPEHIRRKQFRGPPCEAAEQPDEDYIDGKTAQKAIELLRENKDLPFFLAVGFVKPHLPLTCPKKYWDLYPPETIQLPGNYYPPEGVPPMALHNYYELRGYAGMPQTGDIPHDAALNLIRAYRACVSFLDAQVGKVVDELDRLGLRENTIVVFWGDHGYHLGENRLWTKMTNFEMGTHVPLIISVPGQKNAGKNSEALVELVDIYPTLAQLCSLPAPERLEGASLAPLLEKPGESWKNAVFSQYGRGRGSRYAPEKDPMGRSIRTEDFRYTEWRSPAGEIVGVELYDQIKDPFDNKNLASNPAYEKQASRLAERLKLGWKAALPGNN